ncbi:MAG: GerMN domain-containing protein [Phycisphaerae bacterium]|nr:GerMN domain-containing protein [Phycisphaerae bacterium]
MRSFTLRAVQAACFCAGLAAVCHAGTVSLFFFNETVGVQVERPVAEQRPSIEAALALLAAGPTPDEQARGLTTAIPQGTTVASLSVEGPRVTVVFSGDMLSAGMTALRVEYAYRQVDWTLRPFGLFNDIRIMVGDKLVSEYLPALPVVAPRPPRHPAGFGTLGALTGHSITLSPGHGVRWNGSSWAPARPQYCAPLNNEDFHNPEIAQYLQAFLEADGMIVHPVRCMSKSYGLSPYAGLQWWQISANAWLKHTGYPCEVYASITDDCTLGTGESEHTDDIYSRPLSSDYDGTDIYISVHTNGLTGYCIGPDCPTGTETYYDASGEHAAWGAVSESLANNVNTGIMDALVAHVDNTWVCRGACVKNSNGAYGEISTPDRAAILIELGFHDTCDRDADENHLREEFFRSASMWGVYKGVCEYFGTLPTWDFYSDEYVSDTIPSEMIGDEEYTVRITFRNRGVLWSSSRGFCLGAVDDSDPFTSFNRVTPTLELAAGKEYTFTFTMTAPRPPGLYTTDWRMLREGVTWFGDTATRVIDVKPPWTPGDHDHDGDVDQVDFGHLQACLSGSQVPQDSQACAWAMLDDDSDVDRYDFAVFLQCMKGPDIQVDYTCAD